MARPHRLIWRGQLLCDQFGCDAPPGAYGSDWIGGCKLADRQWLCDCYSLCNRGPAPCNKQHRMGLLIFLGLFPTALANLLRVLVIRTAGPVFMSLTNYQVPLWSVIFGILLLNEPFQIRLLVALLLIIIGFYLSQYKALNRLFFGAKS